jgi:hypothetical protein
MPRARSRKVKDSVNEVVMFPSPDSGGSLQPEALLGKAPSPRPPSGSRAYPRTPQRKPPCPPKPRLNVHVVAPLEFAPTVRIIAFWLASEAS